MSNMCPSSWTATDEKFGRPSTAMSQSAIQSFLLSHNSVLAYKIQVWAKNSSGSVYNTGRVLTPSATINQASNYYCINPKVILATIQKESNLITHRNVNANTRAFYFCMGYGATDSGDINSGTGFDKQVDGGTHLLLTFWNEAFNKGRSAFPLSYTDSANIRLKIDNCGTYALYQYTPWVSSNLLFLRVMKMFWPGSQQNSINWN